MVEKNFYTLEYGDFIYCKDGMWRHREEVEPEKIRRFSAYAFAHHLYLKKVETMTTNILSIVLHRRD